MQQYQSYYPQMQMQQPMMFNQMPQYNPYADRLAQLQAQQQQLQASQNMATLGKVVESVDVLKTIEIPMDGNMYYFPKADGTEIYGKKWLTNGTTYIETYKPCLGEVNDDKNDIGNSEIMEKLVMIEEIINKFQTDMKANRNTKKTE